jgi:hypothetical protein
VLAHNVTVLAEFFPEKGYFIAIAWKPEVAAEVLLGEHFSQNG